MKLYGSRKEVVVAGLMRIGQLAAAAGVTNRTVDFYTSLGLIQAARRTEGGFRLYDPATVEIIGTIRRLEASGMALDEIADELANARTVDLTATVTRLSDDVESLHALAEAAGSNVHGVVTALTVRAHQLITTAMELLSAMPNG